MTPLGVMNTRVQFELNNYCKMSVLLYTGSINKGLGVVLTHRQVLIDDQKCCFCLSISPP